MADIPPTTDGFAPSEDDIAGVHEWFARYDELAANAEVRRMADMAMYPLNTVTDDAEGNGSAQQSDRERFIAEMTENIGDGVRMADAHAALPQPVAGLRDHRCDSDPRGRDLSAALRRPAGQA